MRKALEVSVLNRPAGYVSVYEIKNAPFPGRYSRRNDYDPHEDFNPSAKWSGTVEGESTHTVTILAHQYAPGGMPKWTVRAYFNDQRLIGTLMMCSWTTMEMSPERFSVELTLIEKSIVELEEHYKDVGY